MKRKRYDVRGMMEWHPVFRVGRSRVKVSFTGGHLCGGGCTPASFETADPVLQKVIEDSEAFRSGRIAVGLVVESEASGGGEVFEYGKFEEVVDFLQFTKKVPLGRLLDEESAFNEARRLGVTLRKKRVASHEV